MLDGLHRYPGCSRGRACIRGQARAHGPRTEPRVRGRRPPGTSGRRCRAWGSAPDALGAAPSSSSKSRPLECLRLSEPSMSIDALATVRAWPSLRLVQPTGTPRAAAARSARHKREASARLQLSVRSTGVASPGALRAQARRQRPHVRIVPGAWIRHAVAREHEAAVVPSARLLGPTHLRAAALEESHVPLRRSPYSPSARRDELRR